MKFTSLEVFFIVIGGAVLYLAGSAFFSTPAEPEMAPFARQLAPVSEHSAGFGSFRLYCQPAATGALWVAYGLTVDSINVDAVLETGGTCPAPHRSSLTKNSR